jgi:NAD(P)-dependent dehydrogenase (short-subunit alcohol dehydrogenase family)
MIDMIGYAGKRVVVSGCHSGMGRATADLLLGLGAEVHGLDLRESELALASFRPVDLRDPASIDRAAEAIGGPVDALFNCAGLGPTFSPVDIMKVNFIGTRHLTERLLPVMSAGAAIGSIASTAAMGWSRRVPVHKGLIAIPGYADAVDWAEANADEIGEGYSFSKEAIVVWTMLRAQELIGRGIRINCILPGLTQTPMLTDQIAVKTSRATLDEVVRPSGRPGRPEEQAFALVAITSPAASYVNGAALNVDGGRMARVAMGMTRPTLPSADEATGGSR